jgi:hypothetical protein
MAYALVNLNTLEILSIVAETTAVAHPYEYFDCSDSATINWEFDGTNIVLPADVITAAKDKTKANLANFRYTKEVGGITHDSQEIDTSRESQAKLSALKIIAQDAIDANDTAFQVEWKCKDGAWYTLSAAASVALANAVADHVKACYAEEKRLCDLIDGLSTEQEAMEYEYVDAWTV